MYTQTFTSKKKKKQLDKVLIQYTHKITLLKIMIRMDKKKSDIDVEEIYTYFYICGDGVCDLIG